MAVLRSSRFGLHCRGLAGAVVLMCAILVPLVTAVGNGPAGAVGCGDPGGAVALSNGICTAAFSAYDANFNPIMTTQSFSVPSGVTSLNVVVDGGYGGLADVGPGLPAYGGQESGTITVKSGATLTLVAGTNGVEAGTQTSNETGSGWPDGGNSSPGGGGGGGGSYVYDSSGNLLLAAGGGGGAGDGFDESIGGPGGNGGGAGGGAAGQGGALNAITTGNDPNASGAGGGGATVSGGGSGGDNSSDCPAGGAGDNGPAGQDGEGPAPSPFVQTPDGGDGGTPTPPDNGFGTSCLQTGAGGGGGGYYGGGGGGAGWAAGGGGGGGSGYAATTVSSPKSGVSSLSGVASEGGAIFISYPLPGTPVVESLTTTQGPVVGGEQVTINGSGFTGATAVNFVGAGGTTTVTLPTPSTSDTSITVNAPNLSQQMNTAEVNTNYTVDVEVVTPGGTSQASPPGDSYTAMVPVVTAVNTTVNGNTAGPAAGPVVGGETITLTGQWLNGADSVSFQPTGNTSFVSAQPVNVSGTGTIATFTAPNATSEYTASGVTGDLFTDLIVDIPVQNSNTASVTSSPTSQGANDKFYLVPVAVTDLSDHQAGVVGGTVVDITGTDLTNGTVVLAPTAGTLPSKGCGSGSPVPVAPNSNGTDTSLAFTAPNQTDAMLATGGDVTCDVEVQVPVPELGAGVTVTSQPNPGNPGDTLTYPYPVVNSVSPNNGPLGKNTDIIITGSGLIGVSQVQFVLTGGFLALPVSSSVTPPSTLSNTVSDATPTGGELLVSGDPTLTTDVEVEIPATDGGFITSAPNSPGDNYTFTQANACTGLNACTTGASTGSAPAVASSTGTNGSVTITGTGGAGSVTVGRYSANPVGTPTFTTGGSYFDASVESGSAFTSVTLQDCDLGGGTSLQWWNPAANSGAGAWQAVVPLTGPTATTPPCVTATFGATSSPTLAQLTGTVFVAETPAIVGTAPTFTVDTPPSTATIGATYSYTFTATGKPTPTYALASGAPNWLSINSTTGAVSGTPPTGTTSFVYSVTASNGDLPNATAGPFTVMVTAATAAPVFTTDTPPLTATVGTPYSYAFHATGTPTPTYALASGAPTWLSINSTTGAVSGTPPTGTTSFVYSVTASNGDLPNATAGPFTVIVTAATAAPVFTTDTPPLTATVGTPYSYTFHATGTPTPTYALASGAPSWLSINSTTGVVIGTVPTGTTTFTYSVKAKNAVSSVTVGPFKVAVSNATAAPVFTADTPPLTTTVGMLYSYAFQATGTPTPRYEFASGAPSWLTINTATGVVSGTVPNWTTSFTYSVRAKNSVTSVTAGPFQVAVRSRTVAPSFTAAAPPLIATAGRNYSYTFQATGTPTPRYALAAGAPTWLSINSFTGALSGTVPKWTATFTYSVKATNSVNSVTAGPFKVSVSAGTGCSVWPRRPWQPRCWPKHRRSR